jgi:hypothetical protein
VSFQSGVITSTSWCASDHALAGVRITDEGAQADSVASRIASGAVRQTAVTRVQWAVVR